MSKSLFRAGALTCAVSLAAVGAAACTAKDNASDTIAVTSTDSACDLSSSDAGTGNVKFTVTNNGGKVTEFYVFGNNNRVLGEVENIGPGLNGTLTVEITDPGTYTVACKPGMVGEGIRKQINVTGDKKDKSTAPADVEAAKKNYLEYVRNQLNTLQSQAEQFTTAIKNNDLDKARAMFGQARTPYERIEPVAESFPDLDPAIDMRWDDTEGGKTPFVGFHRLERFLWPPKANELGEQPGQVSPADAAHAKTEDTKENIDKVADQLMRDITTLKTEVNKPDFEFETQSFVKGAQALIDEVAATKVGGEEDRYSHADLYDFAANVEGSQTLIADMEAIITKKNATLMAKINEQFKAVTDGINAFRDGNGYRNYAEVTADQRKDLSNKIDALSASLSQVPDVVMSK